MIKLLNKLATVREDLGNKLPSQSDKSIIFDWDDDYHFAITFKKGDSRAQVAEKLHNAHRELLALDNRINKNND